MNRNRISGILACLLLAIGIAGADIDTINTSSGVLLTGEIRNWEKISAKKSGTLRLITTDNVVHLCPLRDITSIRHAGTAYNCVDGTMTVQGECSTENRLHSVDSSFGVYQSVTAFQNNQLHLLAPSFQLREVSQSELRSYDDYAHESNIYNGNYYSMTQIGKERELRTPQIEETVWGVRRGDQLFRKIGDLFSPIRKLGTRWWYSIPTVNKEMVAQNVVGGISSWIALGLTGVAIHQSINSENRRAGNSLYHTERVVLLNTDGLNEHELTPAELRELLAPYPDLFTAYTQLDSESQERQQAPFFFRAVRRASYISEHARHADSSLNLGIE